MSLYFYSMNTDLVNANGGVPTVPESAVANNAVSPLGNLEGVVPVAKPEVAATQPTAPVQAPKETPKVQFENQFGSGPATPPVAEVPEIKQEDSKEAPVAQLDPSIKTVDDLLTKGPQVVEVEQTPAEKLKQEIAATIDAFLEEVTKEKTAA